MSNVNLPRYPYGFPEDKDLDDPEIRETMKIDYLFLIAHNLGLIAEQMQRSVSPHQIPASLLK